MQFARANHFDQFPDRQCYSSSFSAATMGDGVAVEDSEQGLIQFDSGGGASLPVAGFSNWGPWALGALPLISSNELAFVEGPDIQVAQFEIPSLYLRASSLYNLKSGNANSFHVRAQQDTPLQDWKHFVR